MGKQLVIYTRQPSKELYYDPRLAYSMHLAYVEDGYKECYRAENSQGNH